MVPVEKNPALQVKGIRKQEEEGPTLCHTNSERHVSLVLVIVLFSCSFMFPLNSQSVSCSFDCDIRSYLICISTMQFCL